MTSGYPQLEVADRRGEQVRRRSWAPGVKRALIVVCVFFIFQQITGIKICFAVLCLFAIGFVYRFLPETKGRSVEEITELFKQQPRTGAVAA